MIKLQRIGEVGLVVRDLRLSLDWYSRHFGMRHLYDVSNGVIIGVGDVELWLAEAGNPDSARASDTAGDICIRLVGFQVDEEDFDRILAEFSDDDDLIEVDHPLYRSCIIEDPDGHAIELYVQK